MACQDNRCIVGNEKIPSQSARTVNDQARSKGALSENTTGPSLKPWQSKRREDICYPVKTFPTLLICLIASSYTRMLAATLNKELPELAVNILFGRLRNTSHNLCSYDQSDHLQLICRLHPFVERYEKATTTQASRRW
jgi:hypothetical protein